jgi:hypothetical protein
MQLTKIYNFFKGKIVTEDFKKHIDTEVANYKQSLNKKGNSSPIYLNEDLDNFQINEDDIRILFISFLQNKLDKWELNYVAEALMLSEKISFNNGTTKDAILSLVDPEYFKLINTKFVQEILDKLDTERTPE